MKTLRAALAVFLIAASTQKVSGMEKLQEAFRLAGQGIKESASSLTGTVYECIGVRTRPFVLDIS